MNHHFDELAKELAQSVTRRQGLKKFAIGLAGMALACLGLADNARAGNLKTCFTNSDCGTNHICYGGYCRTICHSNGDCKSNGLHCPCVNGLCEICSFLAKE